MKCKLQRPIFILRSNVILTHNLYDIYTSNTLQDIRQNYWTVKYRSLWTTSILRSNFGSYWKYDIYTWNTLQDIYTWNNPQDVRLNHWTLKILQDTRQNHWTMKNRPCWLSLHDLYVNVTRLTYVWPSICLSCFHNRKVEKTHFTGVLVFNL